MHRSWDTFPVRDAREAAIAWLTASGIDRMVRGEPMEGWTLSIAAERLKYSDSWNVLALPCLESSGATGCLYPRARAPAMEPNPAKVAMEGRLHME